MAEARKAEAAITPHELIRLLFIYEARYAENPAASARGMAAAAIQLHAMHSGAGEAAFDAAQVIADVGAAERRRRRGGSSA